MPHTPTPYPLARLFSKGRGKKGTGGRIFFILLEVKKGGQKEKCLKLLPGKHHGKNGRSE
jgi:hypothetical protein